MDDTDSTQGGHDAVPTDGVPEPANGVHPLDPTYVSPDAAQQETRASRRTAADYGRAMRMTALSFLVPGSGLTQTSRRALGFVQLGATVLGVLALAALVITKGPVKAATALAARPSLLMAIAIVFIIAGLCWVASIWATSRLLRPSRLDPRRARTLTALATVLCILAAVVSGYTVQATLAAQGAVSTIFGSGAEKGTAGVKISGEGDPWKDQDRVNILLLGSDAGVGRTGTRTDSMIVASIDPKTGDTVLISLPRSLEKMPLAEDSPLRKVYPSGYYGVPTCKHTAADDQCMLNAVWSDADELAATDHNAYAGAPSPGRVELRSVISTSLGIPINQTVVIDLAGFEQLIDAMGGVTINVQLGPSGKLPIGVYQSHYDPNVVVGNEGWFKAGVQHLNGHLALWYARARATDDDTHRQGRQRCVLKAVVKQVNPTTMLTKFASIMQIAKDNIYTDISADHLDAYVTLVERMQKGKIVSLALDTSNKVYAGNPDWTLVRKLVKNAITPPPPPKPAPKPTQPGEMPDETASPTPTPSTTSATSTTPSTSPTSTEGGTVVDPCDVPDPAK